MHIVMVTTGTLGDVQPFVALGVGLRGEGYEVTVATHPDYEALITGNGLAFRRVGVSFKEQMGSPAGRNWLESGDSLVRYKEAVEKVFVPATPRWTEDALAATLDADVLIFQPFAALAYHQAERRGIPAVCVSPFPVVGTGEIEPAFWPAAPRWRWLRRRMNAEAAKLIWSVFGKFHEAERARLGLPAWRSSNPLADFFAAIPVLHAYSPSMVPVPGDWGPHAHVTGYCFLEAAEAWTPPPKLVEFLAGGPPPIYVGFGSMTGRDPEALARLAIDAVSRTKQRTILAGGWSGIGRGVSVPDHVFSVESVPHDWLFPRVSAVVHHGGAGTTAAGLRAGKPTLVTAFFGDQLFWGRRVARAGAGPTPILRRKLDASKLAHGIAQTLGNASYREGAMRVAEALSREDGVANAVAVVKRCMGEGSPVATSKVA